MNSTTDTEIREAFHTKELSVHHKCPNTIVIDELGVYHGRKRIDVAVLNGCIHGYEIKSSKDNLSRFSEQLEAYTQCFEKLSIITAKNHLDALRIQVPEWCGLILAEKDARGVIHFEPLRIANENPSVDLVAMAHFLWKNEAVGLLRSLGEEEPRLKGTRASLYQSLSERTTVPVLSSWIKDSFTLRENWRVDQQQV